MSPVRTTKSASGPFSVRSYLRVQSCTGSPVAAAGVMGSVRGDGVSAVVGEVPGSELLFPSVGFVFGAALLLVGAEGKLEGDEPFAA